jgi:hypothetical protein
VWRGEEEEPNEKEKSYYKCLLVQSNIKVEYFANMSKHMFLLWSFNRHTAGL